MCTVSSIDFLLCVSFIYSSLGIQPMVMKTTHLSQSQSLAFPTLPPILRVLQCCHGYPGSFLMVSEEAGEDCHPNLLAWPKVQLQTSVCKGAGFWGTSNNWVIILLLYPQNNYNTRWFYHIIACLCILWSSNQTHNMAIIFLSISASTTIIHLVHMYTVLLWRGVGNQIFLLACRYSTWKSSW